MNDARTAVLAALRELRPEASPEELPAGSELREELDLDSMDVLNLIIALSDSTGIDIPEEDYRYLATLDDCIAYLEARGA